MANLTKSATLSSTALHKKTPTQPTEVSEIQMHEPLIMRGKASFLHHLYKLKPAKMKRNSGYTDENPIIVELEHCHIFHTCDSNGKKQLGCAPIGGHHHQVTVIENGPGKAPTLQVSTAKKWVQEKKKGKIVKYEVDVTFGDELDNHTHEYEYVRSEELHPRKPNLEAAKLEVAMATLHSPSIPGVIET